MLGGEVLEGAPDDPLEADLVGELLRPVSLGGDLRGLVQSDVPAGPALAARVAQGVQGLVPGDAKNPGGNARSLVEARRSVPYSQHGIHDELFGEARLVYQGHQVLEDAPLV